METTITEVWMQVKDRALLRQAMEDKGLGVRALTRKIGLAGHSYLSRILSGEIRTLRPEIAVRIALALDVSMYDLFLPKATKKTSHRGQKVAS